MKRTQTISIVIAASLAIAACDTDRNFEAPESYAKLIGTDGDQEGVDVVVAGDSDGDTAIFILGNTNYPSGLGKQIYLSRTTPDGIVVWQKNFGGPEEDEARDIELVVDPTMPGTLAVLAMKIDNATGNRDFMVRLISVDGFALDSVEYGVAGKTEEAYTISEISGGFIVSGYTDNLPPIDQPDPLPDLFDPGDALFVRYTKDLTEYPDEWSVSIGGDNDFDVAIKTIEVIPPGKVVPNYYVFGYSNHLEPGLGDLPDYNVFVWVLNDVGGQLKRQFFIGNSPYIPGSTLNADERLSSVALVPASSGSGYVLSGYSVDPGSNTQRMFTMQILQHLVFDDPVNDNIVDVDQIFADPPRIDNDAISPLTSASGASVFPSQRGGFLVLGCQSMNGDTNLYLKKLDDDLTDAWTVPTFFSFGGVGNDLPGGVAETPGGGIVVVGTMVLGEANGQKKVVLLKLSADGKL